MHKGPGIFTVTDNHGFARSGTSGQQQHQQDRNDNRRQAFQAEAVRALSAHA
jgi:hypothetical protein